jgi:hypothetical protein
MKVNTAKSQLSRVSFPASSDTVVAEGRQMQQNENGKKGENPLLKNIKNKQSGPPYYVQ